MDFSEISKTEMLCRTLLVDFVQPVEENLVVHIGCGSLWVTVRMLESTKAQQFIANDLLQFQWRCGKTKTPVEREKLCGVPGFPGKIENGSAVSDPPGGLRPTGGGNQVV